MEYKEISLEKFFIAGIAVKTTNKDNKSQNDIGKLWDEFFKRNVTALIPNKLSDDILCVYTDYESDYRGEYTTIIGYKIADINNIPQKVVIREIPACKYREYTSVGKIPDNVAKTWFHIWNSDIDRKYIADFDVYGIDAQDADNAIVKTYLSIQ